MHPCARCATIQKTCCQRAEVVITAGDAARIGRHTGRQDFAELRAPHDPTYLDQDDDPNWAKYTVEADGRRRVLRRRADGSCTFLSEFGCCLPTEVRPLVCRLYPHSYTESGIVGVEGEYCPVERLVPPGLTLLTVLGMRPDEARRWHRMLYDELRTGAESVRTREGVDADEHRAYL